MKRFLLVLLAALMLFCMASCDEFDPSNKKPKIEYYENGNIKEKVVYTEDGSKYTFEYREDGKITKEINKDYEGNTSITTYEYDDKGNLILQRTLDEGIDLPVVETRMEYTEDNKVYRSETYLRGKLNSITQFSEDGSYYVTEYYDNDGNIYKTEKTEREYYEDHTVLDTTKREDGSISQTYISEDGIIWGYDCDLPGGRPTYLILMPKKGITLQFDYTGYAQQTSRTDEAIKYHVFIVDENGIESKSNLSRLELFTEKTETYTEDGNVYTKIRTYYDETYLIEETTVKGEYTPDYISSDRHEKFLEIFIRNVIYKPDGSVLYDTAEDKNEYVEESKHADYISKTAYNSQGRRIWDKSYSLEGVLVNEHFWMENGNSEFSIDYGENGKAERKSVYNENGELISLIRYGENGNIIGEDHYENGAKKSWVNYYENGQKRTETTFCENGKIKSQIRYYESGQVETESIRNENGEDISWIRYRENGKKIDETLYENGKIKVYYSYYENGQKKSECYFYENGQEKLKIMYFEDGRKDSEYSFDEKGKKLSETIYYKDGRVVITEYDENGAIKSKTELEKDETLG